MESFINKLKENKEYYIEKAENIAGYFVQERFQKLEFTFSKEQIELFKTSNIQFSDFSECINSLCKNDYSKLITILILAYSVEI